MTRDQIASDLILDKISGKGIPLVGDKGYSTIDLVRRCTEKKVPWVGTIQNNYLKGNFPIFPDDKTSKKVPFKKRMYTFRVKNEPIFLTALYDHSGQKPVCFISNFHCGEFSKFVDERPIISLLYNSHMIGVDLFDKVAFYYSISRKTYRWPIRVIENVVGFALTNSRAAYSVHNFVNMTKYTMRHFFLDILRQKYKKVEILRSINIEHKVNRPKPKTCFFQDCKNRSHIPCSNKDCEKITCLNHSNFICLKCCQNPKLNTELTICKNIKSSLQQKKCNFFCKKRCKTICSVCFNFYCTDHRFKFCYGCCYGTSSGLGNYSVPFKPLNIKNR